MGFGVGLMNGVEPGEKVGEVLSDRCRIAIKSAELKVGRVVFDGEGASVKLAVTFEHRVAVRALRIDFGASFFAGKGIDAATGIYDVGVADGDRPRVHSLISL